jgi:hypothetical protein
MTACTVAQVQAMGIGLAEDTIVQHNNSVNVPVDEFEIVGSLTSATSTAEASDLSFKILTAGAKVLALHLVPNAILGRDGTQQNPGFAFQSDPSTGLWLSGGILHLGVGGVGTQGQYTLDNNGTLLMNAVGARIIFEGASQTTFIGRSSATGDMQLGAGRDFVFGPASSLATNAIVGFPAIPTCAGTPTGSPTIPTGKALLVEDSTNHKLYINDGSGWVALN